MSISEMQRIFDKADESMVKLIDLERSEQEWIESQIGILLSALDDLTNEADKSLDMRPSFRRSIANAHSVSCQVKYGVRESEKQRISDCVESINKEMFK